MKIAVISLVFALMGARSADACSVLPIDPTQEKNELVAQALNSIPVSIENVTNVSVASYAGDYVWTPMCPSAQWSKAQFEISFNNVDDPLSKGCFAVIEVSKNWVYEESRFPQYTVNQIQTPTCLE